MTTYRTTLPIPAVPSAEALLELIHTLERHGGLTFQLELESADEYTLAILVRDIERDLADNGWEISLDRPWPVVEIIRAGRKRRP